MAKYRDIETGEIFTRETLEEIFKGKQASDPEYHDANFNDWLMDCLASTLEWYDVARVTVLFDGKHYRLNSAKCGDTVLFDGCGNENIGNRYNTLEDIKNDIAEMMEAEEINDYEMVII